MKVFSLQSRFFSYDCAFLFLDPSSPPSIPSLPKPLQMLKQSLLTLKTWSRKSVASRWARLVPPLTSLVLEPVSLDQMKWAMSAPLMESGWSQTTWRNWWLCWMMSRVGKSTGLWPVTQGQVNIGCKDLSNISDRPNVLLGRVVAPNCSVNSSVRYSVIFQPKPNFLGGFMDQSNDVLQYHFSHRNDLSFN